MIRVENLSKALNHRQVLNNINFHLEEGDVLGIIGPNGVGKSTLLSLLGGFIQPDKGRVETRGQVIGYIPQQLALYEDLSVYDNLKIFAAGMGLSKKQLEDRITSVMERLNLTASKNMRVKKLSGGNQRRVHIGIALMIDPSCLLMDEPVVGVDYRVRGDIERFLLEMSQSGKTLVIASHLKSFLEKVSNKLLILEEGQVVYFGEVNEEVLSKL